MFGANLINMINLQADVVFLGYFLTAANVGYYSAATGLSKFFLVVPQAIQTVSYPATSEYWTKKNISGLQKMLDKSLKYSALALMPAGLAIGFFAEDIVSRIYGQGFQQSALPLQILLLGTVIFGVACTSIGGSLAGINRPDLSLKAAGISASSKCNIKRRTYTKIRHSWCSHGNLHIFNPHDAYIRPYDHSNTLDKNRY